MNCGVLVQRRPAIGGALVLFLLSVGETCMVKASEDGSSSTVVVSSDCAMALASAWSDLRVWFSSQPIGENASFEAYIGSMYGTVQCSESEEQIQLYLYPKNAGLRGGGIKYFISKKDWNVERTFER